MRTLWIIAVIFILGCAQANTAKNTETMEKTIDDGAMIEKTAEGETVTNESMIEKDSMVKSPFAFTGTKLAGKNSPLIDFNKADYENAKKTDKLVVLYFYANWCPICKQEVPNGLVSSFNELEGDRVIGFRVNYNDDQTDNDEVELAREFGVAYQHTKVFLKNNEKVLKSPEGWDKKRYLDEISKYA